MKKSILILFSFIIVLSVVGYYFLRSNSDQAFVNYRHHYTEKEKLNLKKARINESFKADKKQRKLERNIAQSENSSTQSFKAKNPNRKLDEIKRELSLRGADNRIQNTREPQSKIVYGDGKGNEYRLLEDYYAVKKTSENENDFPDAEIRLGHFIVPKELAPQDALRVMENAQTGIPAIFTGLIKVKLTNNELSHNVLRNTNYEIEFQYDHINLVMYKFSSLRETMNAKKILDQNPNVVRATIELLEYERIEQ